MGNRAVLTFDKKPTSNSLGLYLHWNGGPESVLAFVTAADRLGVRDGDYGLARIAQIVGNYFGGTLSLGIGKLKTLDCTGDNGVYKIERIHGQGPVIKQSASGSLRGPWITLDNDELRQHAYWTAKDNVLMGILDANTNMMSGEGGMYSAQKDAHRLLVAEIQWEESYKSLLESAKVSIGNSDTLAQKVKDFGAKFKNPSAVGLSEVSAFLASIKGNQ